MIGIIFKLKFLYVLFSFLFHIVAKWGLINVIFFCLIGKSEDGRMKWRFFYFVILSTYSS